MNMRIGKAELKTTTVSLAQVHHGFAPSFGARARGLLSSYFVNG